jgi:HemY protein
MIRVVFFLIVVSLLSLGAAWLADRPGDVVVTWQGLRIETSVMVAIAAALAAMAALAIVFGALRAIVRAPTVLAQRRRRRLGIRALEAISNGLIAVGAGDAGAARRLAAEANQIAPREPLALLLTAQSAQLAGDRDGAEQAFQAMANLPETKALGLRGLFIEAHRRDDAISARGYAEEAARTSLALPWARRAVLEFRCAEGDWTGALALLEQSKDALGKESYRRQRAVLLTARALATAETDRDAAKADALEAVQLAPTLVPAAALAGRRLAEAGELRKAARIVDKAWQANPHPDLADTYAALRFGDAARDRLVRIEGLAKKVPGHIESALALGRAALDAREFGKARAALARYVAAPSRRVALLMAELERAEHNDEGRARVWLSRALSAGPDPAWTADGYVSDRWLPLSPVSGKLDAFEWRLPLAGSVSTPAPMIEPQEPAVVAAALPDRRDPVPDVPSAALPAAAVEILPAPAPTSTPASAAAEPTPMKADAIIPVVHAPDDPGTETAEETATPPETEVKGWRRLFR